MSVQKCGGVLLAAVIFATASGCSSSQPIQTRFMSENARLRATASEMRVMVRDLARPFGGVLEETADAVIADSDDLALREAVIRWKIDVIPAMHEALFRRDPLEAVLDAGTLLMQLKLHLKSFGAERLMPEQLALVNAAIESMRRDLEDVMIRAGADPTSQDDAWELLEQWAREQPVESTFASRRSTVARLAEFTAVTHTGALSSVSALTEDVDDLMTRIDVYSAALAKQGRWQAELLLFEILAEDGAITAAIETAPPVRVGITDLPVDVASEREAVLAALRAEHELLQAWVRAERIAMQGWASGERDEAIAALTAERIAALDAVGLERELVFAALRAERIAMMDDLDRIVGNTVVTTRTEIFDHVFDRLSRLVTVTLVSAFVGAVVLMLLWRWIGGPR